MRRGSLRACACSTSAAGQATWRSSSRRLVGEAGEVLGVDRAPAAVAEARRRTEHASLRNVSFREGDPRELGFEGAFDAVVGRYVLMFQPDPTALLKQLAALLQRLGVAIPEGMDLDSLPERIRHEAAASASVLIGRSEIGAWSRR